MSDFKSESIAQNPHDPEQTPISDLLEIEQVTETLKVYRMGEDMVAGVFEIVDGKAHLLRETSEEHPQNYPIELLALVETVRTSGVEQTGKTSTGATVIVYPIWLRHESELYLKGCFAGISVQTDLVNVENNKYLARFIASVFSERISSAYSARIASSNYKALEQELNFGARLASTMHNIGIGLMVVDRDMRIMWHNDAVSAMCGEPRLIGKRCYEGIRGDNKICDECLVQGTFDIGMPQQGQMSQLQEDGSISYLYVTTSPIFDHTGKVVYVLELVNDTTPTHLLRSELMYYKRLVDTSDDFLMICDEQGSILAANRRIVEYLGYKEDELIHSQLDMIISNDHAAKAKVLTREAGNQGVAMDFINLKKKNGAIVPTQAMAVFDRDRSVIELIFRDISERLRMEEELRKQANELQVKNRRVLEVMEERNRFFRNVSHELRTPLTSVVGFAQMLLEDDQEPPSEQQKFKLERVVSNSHKLLDLVNELLDLARLDAERMEVRCGSVSLSEFLKHTVSNLSPLAKSKKLKIDVRVADEVPSINTDEQKLGQILINLLSNAIKFTEKGHIDIIAHSDGKSVSISVGDTGTGIPEDELEEIFKEFYRSKSHAANQRGSGLGLTIAKRLAELLGGTLTVISTVGIGSTFTLTMPIVPNTLHKDCSERLRDNPSAQCAHTGPWWVH